MLVAIRGADPKMDDQLVMVRECLNRKRPFGKKFGKQNLRGLAEARAKRLLSAF
jgi:hypothetical protein